MELINEVPPIKVEGRIVACEGGENFANSSLLLSHRCYSSDKYIYIHTYFCSQVYHILAKSRKITDLGISLFMVADNNPALGHPIEYICLDLDQPAVCKYCGLRYLQDHHH